VVLGAHVHLAALSMGRRSPVDVLASLVGTNEGNTLNVWMFAHLRHGVTATLDDVDNAFGHTRLLEQINQQLSRSSHSLRRLDHICVTESDGEGIHPQRDHCREVVWADSSHNSQWHPVRVDIDSTGDTLGGLSLCEGGKAARVLDDLVSAENITC